MRICFVSLRALDCHLVTPRGTPGGSEIQTTLLAQTLAGRGHEVSMVVTDWNNEAKSLPRATQTPLINAYDQRAGLPGLRFFHPRWSGLNRALEQADAEIYYQRAAGAVTAQVSLFARKRGRGFVFGLASDTDADPRAVRLTIRDRRLYARGLKGADRIVAQHGGQQNRLAETYGLESVVIGSIVPRFPGEPVDHNTPAIVLWLGNYRSLKRPDLFLGMAKRFPEVVFRMVGGPTASEPELAERVRSAASSLDNVVYAGPEPDAATSMAQASVLLNTSEIEGFPSSFLEAWAHGVPTLSFVDPGGVVKKNGMGRVVRDPEDLEEELASLVARPGLRRELGERGRTYVSKHHREDVVAAQYEQVMESVCI